MACHKCENGYYEGTLGLKVKCDCIIDSPNKPEKITAGKPVYHINGAEREMAIIKRLVPEHRANDEFDEAAVKASIADMCRAQKCQVKDFQKYIDTLNEIIVTIATNKLRKSFLIGAPNGFGKATFANTCIQRIDAMGGKAVPYISLFELAELRAAHEKMLLGYIDRNSEDSDQKSEEQLPFKWADYMKADVLFTYLTTLENKKVEVKLLKTIMDIRGNKGLPVIVFISTAIQPYLMDHELKKYVWDEILAFNDEGSCDRLLHRSCFKIYGNLLSFKEGKDY